MQLLLWCCAIRGVASFARSGGAKLKSGGKAFRRNANAFSGQNRKFSDQKQVISQKKKRGGFAKILRLFLAKIANSKVFSAQKHELKKIPWEGKKKIGGGGGGETKIGGGAKTKIRGHCPLLATRLCAIV